jgi:predicted PurR-regulated permease PerM
MTKGKPALLGTEVWIAEPIKPRRPRKLAIAAIAVLSLAFLSALGVTLIDVDQWRSSAPQARAVLQENKLSEKKLISSVAILHRDLHESIEVLKRAAESGGPVAAHARVALDELAKQVGR